MAFAQTMVPPPPPVRPSPAASTVSTESERSPSGSAGAVHRRPPPPPPPKKTSRPPPPPPPPPPATQAKTGSLPHGQVKKNPPPPPPPPPVAGSASINGFKTTSPKGLMLKTSPKPPPPPPPPKSAGKGKSPTGRPPPPPPPPPPRSGSAASKSNSASKRTLDDAQGSKPASSALTIQSQKSASASAASAARKKSRRDSVVIRAPTVLRDVTAYEQERKVGEGTYGSVFIGRDKANNAMAALKRINTEQEANGFPITALREVKILKALKHPNIVSLKEIVVSKEQVEGSSFPKDVYMAFELCEYDLTGILETPEIRLTQDHVKSWSHQLLDGSHYMHKQRIIHRDLKASNLLVNQKGELKIADWGLARSWNSEMKRLTNKVITLWYRPPELLLGSIHYTPKIDMWSVGCIIAEMFKRKAILRGATETAQLDLVFRACGTPTKERWPDIEKTCPLWKKFADGPVLPSRLPEELRSGLSQNASKWMTDDAIKLISNLLEMNPSKRWSAEEALLAEWFFEAPMWKKAKDLSMNFPVKSVHEMDCRKKYEQKVQAQAAKVQMAQRAQAAGASN